MKLYDTVPRTSRFPICYWYWWDIWFLIGIAKHVFLWGNPHLLFLIQSVGLSCRYDTCQRRAVRHLRHIPGTRLQPAPVKCARRVASQSWTCRPDCYVPLRFHTVDFSILWLLIHIYFLLSALNMPAWWSTELRVVGNTLTLYLE